MRNLVGRVVGLRQGSIPLVMIVVVVLGLFAGSVIYMTGSSARLEKKSELGDVAYKLAQSAMEETLVKFSNNTASIDTSTNTASTTHYAPHATRLLANRTHDGAQIPPVRVMARLVEKPNDNAQRDLFMQLISAAPAFGGSQHVPDWQTNPPDPRVTDTAKQTALKEMRKAWMEDMNLFSSTDAEKPGLIKQATPTGAGLDYYDKFGGKTENDNAGIREGFENLRSLKPLDWASVDNTEDKVFDTTDSAAKPAYNLHTDVELKEFLDGWNVAMGKVANHVRNRIDGCAGDPNYGVGAELAAFAMGTAAPNNGEAEEAYVQSATNGGVLNYTASLVTVQAEAWVKQGMMSADRTVVGHRIVQTVDLKQAMDLLRKNMVPYLMFHYNLTPRDLVRLGWVSPIATKEDNPKEVVAIAPTPTMFTVLNQRFPDNPSPKVWPYQVANCLSKAQK